ncbi:MAG: hypothetical protein GY765_02200 [bacterium]|nr:hypothetical protein [bacterium]
MPRQIRLLVPQSVGSYHISSSLVHGLILNEKDMKKFLELLKRFAKGFFVDVHAFIIIDGHFHILVTCLDEDAKEVTVEELLERYLLMYPGKQPPIGKYNLRGELIPDKDGGTERLRNRLGSISRFLQELKQMFTRWHNKAYNRTGCLWSSRFTSTMVEIGEAQLNCSAYIDLNSLRVNLAVKPEDYYWSSIGLQAEDPESAEFLRPICLRPTADEMELKNSETLSDEEKPSDDAGSCLRVSTPADSNADDFNLYKEYVHLAGGVKGEMNPAIEPMQAAELKKFHAESGVSDRFAGHVRNISRGIAFGSFQWIISLQETLQLRQTLPRSFMGRDQSCKWSCSCRVLNG